MKVVRSTKSKTKGWGVRVEIVALRGGSGPAESWEDLPIPMARNIKELSEAPEVEYVEVTTGIKMLATFAPRDTEALANLLQGRGCPALAEALRARMDTKLAQEVRELLGAGTPESEET